jgi:hypothetical protein
MGAGERSVTAKIDFAARCKPSQIVTVSTAVALYEKCRLGMIHLDGDRLHPRIGGRGRQNADARRVAAVRLGGKGVDYGDRLRHGFRLPQTNADKGR